MQGRRRPRAKEQRERPADRARVAELARSRRRAAPRTPSRSSRTRSRLHSPVDGTACCLAELQAKVSSSRSREVASPPYLQQSPNVTSPPRLPNESYLFRYAAACCLGDPRCPRRTPSCTEPSTRSASATSGTRSSEQTAIRSARRRRGRFVRRRDRLMETLVGAGLMPVDRTVRKSLERLDPYALRKEALDRRLSPSEIGRALFHLNQRRGFKSNRIISDSDHDERSSMKQGIKRLEVELESAGVRTLGELLAERRRVSRSRERSCRSARPGPSSPAPWCTPKVAIHALMVLRTPWRCARTRRRRCSPRVCSRGGDCPGPASRRRKLWGSGRRCSARPRSSGSGQ